MANKMKNKYGNPQKNIDAFKTAESAKLAKEVDRQIVRNTVQTDKKPMIMRIIVLAIVAVMVLGIVIGAVAGGIF
ncbi:MULTISPECIES: hypothetical protein [Ruminococcus]|uniref:Uncharacterized protein n=1 Tax=Ruminococcus albus (strain ATCC 27210 / DSM 20455 / JCM 14654 / NCDO 2250 / 7) TaxID=697329 RepID=E6UID2_RUMA7|nr:MULTISPECIES: hypothetical protein [Ruminococcus]ADU22193.1 hypothetical protein Rumal_1693 [Ruminococcus albus 7 = DSM 20455]MCR5020675.1 hypothetical protein [Ruminococcus sp.]